MKSRKKWVRVTVWVLLIASILLAAVGRYTKEYYSGLSYESLDVPVEETEDYYIVGDADSACGFIFYPGGKVEAAAYLPLLAPLAEADILCVAVKMPLHLAVMDPDAAAAVMEDFPEVSRWYLGGHSLGGAMAAGFAAENEERLNGLVLLAAYPTKEIKELPVLSVYGSGDGVLNRGKYEKSILLAARLTEHVIEGGNHAQFGNYGAQEGDGAAEIDKEEQWQETVDFILNFMRETE